jgi:hypothetical protein
MFCPKCGTENPNDGRFCRVCGANLVNVLAFVEGSLITESEFIADEKTANLYSSGIRNIILGMGFLVTSLFVKSMPGDTYFWLLFMIPAFCLLGSGIPRILKYEELKKSRKMRPPLTSIFPETQSPQALPPSKDDYIKPRSKYETEELIERPPSVVEGTTRHLELKDTE